MDKAPTPKDVRLIFKNTYLFYDKWKGMSDASDWSKLMIDMREIYNKYPYPLCKEILLELIRVMELNYKNRRGSHE